MKITVLGCGALGQLWLTALCKQGPFSRSYGTILPSSFTRVLSSALVFST